MIDRDLGRCGENITEILGKGDELGSIRGKIIQCMQSDSLEFEFWIFCSKKLMDPNETMHREFLA